MWITLLKGRHCSFVLLFALLTSCGGGGGGTSNTGPGATVPSIVVSGQRSTSTIYSPTEDVQYNLQIYLPAGYANSPTPFPIIYALDGDFQFSTMAAVLDEQGSKAILVGIGRSDRRDIDYQTTGAPLFYQFITTDLVPFIETQYRVRPASRTLVGHSFGGLFVGLALFMDRVGGKYFANFVMLEGTFNVDDFTSAQIATKELQMFDQSAGRLPVTLIMSGADCCYYRATSDLYDKIVSRNYQGLVPYKKQYFLSHGNMFLPAFTDAMRILYP